MAPTVGADNGTVTVSEGATASHTRCFADVGLDDVTLTASAGTNTFDTTALCYRYDTQSAVSPRTAGMESTATVVASSSSANEKSAEPGRALAIPVELNADVRDQLNEARSMSESAVAGPAKTIRLVIGGITPPKKPLGVNVYVGASDTPGSTDSPHYVNTFGFFPTGDAAGEHSDHLHATSFLLEIGDDLARLADQWNADGPLSVHVESVPVFDGAEAIEEAVAPTSVTVEVVEHG